MKMRWNFLLCIAALLAVSVQSAAQQRIALVIGNAAYQSSPLQNPVNDARAMSAKLKNLGFEVIEKQNLATKQIGATLREFRSRLKPGTEALFFYAGHGLQVKGVNYLPAVDADITAEEEVPMQSINVNQVLEIMEEAKTRLNLIFLDACRNNPFSRRFRSAGDGLAKVNAPSGTLISFATRPGSVAADGTGQNGLYTEQLLLAMDQRNMPVEQVLKQAAAGVKKASKGQQEPWSEGMIEGDFYFINEPINITVNAGPGNPATEEQSYWQSAQQINTVEAFQGYLSAYAKGRYVPLAKAAINKLKSQDKMELPAPLTTQPLSPRVAEGKIPAVPGTVDNLSKGKRILARWDDGFWYTGTITDHAGNLFHVTFDDGYKSSLPATKIRPIDWNVGTKVQCNWKNRGRYYSGEITLSSGLAVHINYDDGDQEDTSVINCRSH
ncbi:MAG: caspase family protein [Betaproteobacteria bacterium]|nr:caspase family protein [Betaproteobacteria bacterium]